MEDIKSENAMKEEDIEDKFTMFNQWCAAEGVIMPKLAYPAYFEGGLLGARCTADI